ncbi:SMI1/KNR4 family protein [Dactylosporangium sp. NPDC000521]|uniref:SMI1/KNR4 family protein n=1 Tax=Dactylosporangium sp. NPDC000521 TaxID=3363975 RepID=UPI0036AD0A49
MYDDAVRRAFPGVALDSFWDDGEYALDAYVDEPPSAELVASVQAELGYRLPQSYVTLMKSHNGGIPRSGCCPAPSRTTWAEDHVGVHGIMGIGRNKRYSLAGAAGQRLWLDGWGYPPIGVYFADCPSAGHDMIAFDYSECGPAGEPRVVHVDQEWDYRITVLASDFVSFVQNLRPESEYDCD